MATPRPEAPAGAPAHVPHASGHAPPTDALSVIFCEDRRRFVDLPRAFRSGDPNWTPPLTLVEMGAIDRKRQPFFAHAEAEFFVAVRKGRPVGRISAVRDLMHDAFHHDRVGFFGHFEAADEDAAHALLSTAEDWLQEHEAQELRGPVDLSTNYRCGLLIEGHEDPPTINLLQHPPEYRGWLESYGLQKAKDLLTIRMVGSEFDLDRLRPITERIRTRRNARVRPIRLADWSDEVDRLWSLYNKIWERNWGFVPMSKPEFEFEARSLRQLVVPDLVRFLEVDGEAVGFIIGLPDLNVGIRACRGRLLPFGWYKLKRALKRTNVSRVVTFGLREEHRRSGLELVLLEDYVRTSVGIGYDVAECGWVLEDNVPMLGPLDQLGGSPWRRYRIFQKPIAPR